MSSIGQERLFGEEMFGLFGNKKTGAPRKNDVQLAAIVPVVKAIAFEGDGRTVDLPAMDQPIARPFVADLMVMYAEDKPTHFEFVSRRMLVELGLSEDELHELAMKNLPSRPPKIEIHGSEPKQMLIAGGNFEATLLLWDELWEQIEEGGDGELLAVAPARDLVYISRTSWDGAYAFLTEIADQDLVDKSHLLSRCILRRKAGKWIRHDGTFS